jgi:hypothetical protein
LSDGRRLPWRRGSNLLKIRYTAAAALQRMWMMALGLGELLPDLYSGELGVPAPDEDYGRFCMAALAEKEREMGIEGNAEAVYERAARLALWLAEKDHA